MLDPQAAEVVRRVESWGAIADLTVDEARSREVRRKTELGGIVPAMAESRSIAIPTGHGSVRAVLFRPSNRSTPGFLVWLHGGGWVLGSPELSDDVTGGLALASDCPVLSIDYRLAPEHPFPAGLDDCVIAVEWAAAHPDVLGAGPQVAVGGDSAGGNLAAAVALIARDRGTPRIAFQLLMYPVLSRDLDGASGATSVEGFGLTRKDLDWFWTKYLARPESAANPYASPLLAASLEGLPPALILLGEADILRDQGLRYAERLRHARVPVEVHTFPGQLHSFIGYARLIDQAGIAIGIAGRAVRAALSSAVP